MNSEAAATAPTANAGKKVAASGDGAGAGACVGAESNSSAFSAIFRRSLTATAVAPGTPGVTPTAQENTCWCFSQYPQPEQQLGGSVSTSHEISAVGGGEGGGRPSLIWEAEEKRSEIGSNAAVVASPQESSRPGILRLFGSRNGGDSQPVGLSARWSARVWARLRPAGRGTDDGDLNGLEDAVGTGTSGVSPRNLTNSDRPLEGATRCAEQRSVVAGSLQAVETFTHRRRLAARMVGSSVNGDTNGRGTAGVTAMCGSDGAGASILATDARLGRHRCSLAEVCAASHTHNSRHGVVERREKVRKEKDSLPGRDVIIESSTAGNSVSTAGDVITVACVDPLTIFKRQHHLEVKGLEDAGKEKGGGGKESGDGDNVAPLRNASPKSVVLPRARVLWRAFSEVDHDTIEESHRRARLRYLERLDPPPGILNPPTCYSPAQG